MKKIAPAFLFALALSFPALTKAQIPNAGFETWAGGEPVGWVTTNYPGYWVPVTQTANVYSGYSALQGTVIDYYGYLYPPSSIRDSRPHSAMRRSADGTRSPRWGATACTRGWQCSNRTAR